MYTLWFKNLQYSNLIGQNLQPWYKPQCIPLYLLFCNNINILASIQVLLLEIKDMLGAVLDLLKSGQAGGGAACKKEEEALIVSSFVCYII